MLRIGFNSYAGNRYQGLNQDRLISHRIKKPNKSVAEESSIWLGGICDGHNFLGDLAAATCCSSFQKTTTSVRISIFSSIPEEQIKFNFHRQIILLLLNLTTAILALQIASENLKVLIYLIFIYRWSKQAENLTTKGLRLCMKKPTSQSWSCIQILPQSMY